MKGNGIITSLSQKQNYMVNDYFFSCHLPFFLFFFFAVAQRVSWLESFFFYFFESF